jgi:2'-5' RNA ligase
MPYAIEIYFDSETERVVRRLRSALNQAGIRPVLDELGDRPHISLAGVAHLNEADFEPHLRDFAADVRSFPTVLAAVGSFPGDEGVLFLAPAFTQPLLTVHASFHQLLGRLNLRSHDYYTPGNWMPHCTIA